MARWRNKMALVPKGDKSLINNDKANNHSVSYGIGAASQMARNDTHARAAILAFLGELDELCGDDTYPFHWLRRDYKSLSRERGWPPLKDRALTQGLQRIGCTPRKVDRRSEGKGRYVVYEIPNNLNFGIAA